MSHWVIGYNSVAHCSQRPTDTNPTEKFFNLHVNIEGLLSSHITVHHWKLSFFRVGFGYNWPPERHCACAPAGLHQLDRQLAHSALPPATIHTCAASAIKLTWSSSANQQLHSDLLPLLDLFFLYMLTFQRKSFILFYFFSVSHLACICNYNLHI